MIYRPYGKTEKMVSALGFGSIRFRTEDLANEDGMWRCAELVRTASAVGVNFYDVAPTYANGLAERIYGLAFRNMPNPFFVSDKSIITTDKTADDVRRRIDQSLEIMGIPKITFYHMWSIMNLNHYLRVMARGGPYEGAMQAKLEGLIEHICFSTHANAAENLEIVDSGVFEGMILSFNILNFDSMRHVVGTAAARGMGVAAMNPLCGGMLTRQTEHFKYLLQPGDDSVATAALRFVSSFPGMTTVLSGMAEADEIMRNAIALSHDQIKDRIERVQVQAQEIGSQFCTGCGYCGDCPQSIPISDYMKAYNMRVFPNMEYMGRTIPFAENDQINANNIFRALRQNSGIVPKNSENPCVKCGQCEKKCTQHIPIISCLEDMFNLAAKHEYSQAHLRQRITDALAQTPTGRLGLYPTGVYTEAFYTFIREFFPNACIQVFDKNSDLWGMPFSDLTISAPHDIPDRVDVLLITHFIYQNEIYKKLSHFEEKGVRVIKLHKAGDIPYFC